MIAQRYQDLDCWQLSNELKLRVYAFIAKPPASKDFEFCDQIRRSSRGAPRTISEGFGGFPPKEFARYLEFARASLMETQNHLTDARDSGYITTELHDELFAGQPRHRCEHPAPSISSDVQGVAGKQGARNPEPGNPEPANQEPENQEP